MRVARRHWHYALLILAGSLAACGGDSHPTGPGLGGEDVPHPFEHPTGTPFALPAGVSVNGEMTGAGAIDGPCAAADKVGTSLGFVAVCMTLHNANSTDTTVVFPAGLVLIATDTATQNGTQVTAREVRVPAGRDTTIVYNLFCVNAHRNPSFESDTFTFGPVSDNAGLLEIIGLVQGKSVDNLNAADLIQGAVWEVSDDGGLTDGTRAQLKALP